MADGTVVEVEVFGIPDGTVDRVRELRGVISASVEEREQTQMLIETPYRNAALLAALLATLAPTTRVAVSCGLTLAGGWTRSDTVAGWRAQPVQMHDRWPAVFSLLA